MVLMTNQPNLIVVQLVSLSLHIPIENVVRITECMRKFKPFIIFHVEFFFIS